MSTRAETSGRPIEMSGRRKLSMPVAAAISACIVIASATAIWVRHSDRVDAVERKMEAHATLLAKMQEVEQQILLALERINAKLGREK